MREEQPLALQESTRSRALQLAHYLHEYVRLRQKVMGDLADYRDGAVIWLAEVPSGPGTWTALGSRASLDGLWLKVAQQDLPPRPPVPDVLTPWVKLDDDLEREPALRAVLRDSELEAAAAQPDDVTQASVPDNVRKAWDSYVQELQIWRATYAPRKKVHDIYSKLFRIRQQQQRRSESCEVVIGLGLLAWKTKGGRQVFRHVCTSQVELEFDSTNATIMLRCPDTGARLRIEDDMLEPAERPAPDQYAVAQAHLNLVGDAIWDTALMTTFLRSWGCSIHSDTRLVDDVSPPARGIEQPTLHFAPALILRPRPLHGLVTTYRAIAEQIASGIKLPALYARLVQEPEQGLRDPYTDSPPSISEEREDVLFPLPANDEQFQIVSRLAARPGVLVQGPPGTGKTQTIANLVCHLLAEGKRVLVTSETTRALRLVRAKIPADLQPLCVSLLDADARSQAELAASVGGITRRHIDWSPEQGLRAVAEASQRLIEARQRLAEVDARLRGLREQDSFEVCIGDDGGYRGTTAVIARRIAGERAAYGWIDAHVIPSLPPPLDDVEASHLLALTRSITPERARELRLRLPSSDLRSELVRFPALADREQAAAAMLRQHAALRASEPYMALVQLAPNKRGELRQLVAAMAARLRRLGLNARSWVTLAIADVSNGSEHRWQAIHSRLAVSLDGLAEKARIADTTALSLAEGNGRDEVLADAALMLRHLERGGSWKWMGLWPQKTARGRWYLRSEVRVDGQLAENREVLARLIAVLETRRTFAQLQLLVGDGLGLRLTDPFEAQVHWFEDMHSALTEILALGSELEQFRLLLGHRPTLTEAGLQDAERMLDIAAADTARTDVLAAMDALRRLVQLNRDAGEAHPIHDEFLQAFADQDVARWHASLIAVQELAEAAKRLAVRTDLESRLAAALPSLASLLQSTCHDAQWDARLHKFTAAWRWGFASQQLMLDQSPELHARLVRDRARYAERESVALTELTAARAWRHCLDRLESAQAEALKGWRVMQDRIGKGYGKNVEGFRKEARKYMHASEGGIPVWIMPRYRVAESIGAKAERFDVVIIDEASQSGIDGLFLFYLGERIVVVGDDQQISPEDVGIAEEHVEALRQKWLPLDIAHREMLRTRSSLYDHALLRFDKPIVLREHFRCMPEIIQFSNDLCYAARGTPLIPLRQYSASRLDPIVLRLVEQGFREGSATRVRNAPEADALVEELVQCDGDPRYAGKSFGVISLQGKAQAQYIERLLLERLGPKVVEARRLTCGDAYEFQGDERDIVFLSMVCAPNERAASLTKPSDLRRFNVAASRARDQLWLFHSVLLHDLQPECVRRRLLSHCLTPQATERASETLEFETEFERDVHSRLTDQGYVVRTQVPAGDQSRRRYRIDLVVEGSKSRIAVECDDDHWHGAERYNHDQARERMLERAGWTFHHIRESEFRLSPDRALKPLLGQLEELAIYPRYPNGEGTAEPIADGQKPKASVDESSSALTSTRHILDAREAGAPVRAEAPIRVETPRSTSKHARADSNGPALPITPAAPRSAPQGERLQPHPAAASVDAALRAFLDAVRPGGNTVLERAIRAIRDAALRSEPIPEDSLGLVMAVRAKCTESFRLESRIRAYKEELGIIGPVHRGIATSLPAARRRCSSCNTMRQIKVESGGPILKCNRCNRIESVGRELVASVIRALGIPCRKCGSPSIVPNGPYGIFVGCSGYPRCRNVIKWKDLHQISMQMAPLMNHPK